MSIAQSTDTPLFDALRSQMRPLIGVPFNEDTARARRSDPVESHVAADVSARTRAMSRAEILRLIFELGPVDGQALNAAYAGAHPLGDPLHLAYDSPRKRAGELVLSGDAARLESHIAANNLPAGAYVLTAQGFAEVAA